MSSPLKAYRQELLERLLKGILPFWFIALAGGLINIYQTLEDLNHPALLRTAVQTAFLYLLLTALVFFLALTERVRYTWRAAAFLFVLYVVAALGLAQAALFGDGRVVLFAFIVLSGIFFDFKGGLFAFVLSALTMGVMGWLHVQGALYLPSEIPNTRDPAAWFSGTFVLLTLGFGAWIAVQTLIHRLEKQWQESEQTRQHEQFLYRLITTIGAINQQIVRAHQKEALLKEVCHILTTLQEYSLAWIGLTDRNGKIQPVAIAGHSPEEKRLLLSQAQERELQCIRQVLEQGAPLLVTDVTICEKCPLQPNCPQRQAIILPLVRNQRRWGILFLSHDDKPFLPEEENVLEGLADDLAFAIEKLYTEEQTEKLTQFAPRLLTAHTLDELWNRVIRGVYEILHADRVAIYTYDREKDRVSCLRYSGLSEEYIDAVNRLFRDLPGSRVFRSPQPVVVQDILSDPSTLPLREQMIREGFRSYAVFPIFSASGIVAAFVAYRNGPLTFTSHEINIGQAMVNVIAQALENLNLYERLRNQASDLGRLYAAAQDMAASLLDPSALLQVLTYHVLNALEVTSCALLVLDESQSTLTVLAEAWGEKACAEERVSRLGKSASIQDFPTVIRAIQSGLPIPLFSDSPDLSAAERAQFDTYCIQSMLVVPILVRGRLIGLIQIRESRQRREFTQAEIRLAQAMAGFGTVLESAQLFQELERREAFFRAVIEHAADGIAILDEQGYFRYLSPSVERLLGHPLEDITNRSPFQYIHPDDLPLMHQAWEEGIRQPGIIRQVNYRFRNAQGEWRHIEAVARNLLHDPNVRGVVINFRDVTERIEAQQKLQQYAQALAEAYDRTLEGWAKALELRDELTEDHTRRVVEMSVKFARLLGLDETQIAHIRRGAILHDIGKMAIPDAILHKRGPLTVEERRLIQRHPQFAYEMLYPIEFLRPALDIPYCHHERWDGKGYPRRLKGDAIPLAARIFSIVDVWDAVTSDRPYRRAWSRERALEYIRSQAGKMFDPTLVEFFIQHLDIISPL
ncbi:MAG: HD domain-containing phosphohydrolase [Anaerolineales bacterium]